MIEYLQEKYAIHLLGLIREVELGLVEGDENGRNKEEGMNECVRNAVMGGKVDEERELSQVEVQARLLCEEIDTIGAQTERLLERLSVVLRPEHPVPVKPPEPEEPELVTMAGGLRRLRKDLAGSNDRLRSFFARLEL